jgi:hypothetical protein
MTGKMTAPLGETTKTDIEVLIYILKSLKLNIFHVYSTKKMPQSRDSSHGRIPNFIPTQVVLVSLQRHCSQN